MGFDMKEYLIKINGAYKLCNLLEDDVTDEYIEIPKGSVKAYLNRSRTINFVNADDDYMNGVTHGEWVDTHRGKHESSGHQLVWQRESMKDNSITKDYLEKQPDGSYVMKSGFAFKDAGWIEIPEGANGYYQYTKGEVDNTFFLNKTGDSYYFANDDNDYSWDWYAGEMKGHEFALWERSESPNDKLASAEQYRQAEVLPFIDDEPKSAWDTQVGGDHYKKYKIQPMLFALENNLNPLQHSVLKYIMRHEDKNGKQDLEKAKHYIDLMIAHHYPSE